MLFCNGCWSGLFSLQVSSSEIECSTPSLSRVLRAFFINKKKIGSLFRCKGNSSKINFGVFIRTSNKTFYLIPAKSKAELCLVKDERQHKDENIKWEYCIHEFYNTPLRIIILGVVFNRIKGEKCWGSERKIVNLWQTNDTLIYFLKTYTLLLGEIYSKL